MVVSTAPRPRLSYTSFPRTSPNRSYSQESTAQTPPPSTPWFACGAKSNNLSLEPGNPTPPSPMITVRHKHRDGLSDPQQQRSQPSYPTTIEFTPSQDPRHAPFDEAIVNDISLQEISLEDTFGFAESSKIDDPFERLYSGNDNEEDGTFQSSIDLNSYSPKDKALIRSELNKSIDESYRNIEIALSSISQTQATKQPRQQGRDSIFRSHNNNASQNPSPPREKNSDETKQLLSPTTAMERRLARGQAHGQEQLASVATPASSFFTSTPAQSGPVERANRSKSILRNNTGILRNNTGTSIQRNNTRTSSRSRHRSTSRSHRSRNRSSSRSHRRHRSRSRSTSVAPPKSGDDYHQNLFRGAKMIREQLLRSMASADHAMDEAEREFMEEMIEKGSGKQGEKEQRLQALRRKMQEKDDGFEEGDIDFDYSLASEPRPGIAPSPSRDSSALESEGRRLDNLVSIFGKNGSTTSSSHTGLDVQRSSSDKENGLQTHTNAHEENGPHVITPTSSMIVTSPQPFLVAPAHETNVHNEYASRYFQDDAPKRMTSRTTSEATAQAHKEHSHPKYQVTEEELPTQTHQIKEVDEAFAHAQKAGPLWRSLVGNHVRLPSQWESTLPSSSPPIHRIGQTWSKWFYVARHRVKGDKRLNSREYGVRSRRTGGRILLRLVVREMHSQQVCREIAIGCFHPNSKGIRKGDPYPDAEEVREVWMGVRWLMDDDEDEPTLDLRREGNNYEGVLDNFLMQKKGMLEYRSMGSPLGHRKAVNNENVRAVFGDQPPMTTVVLHEDEVAEILKANGRKKLAVLPALLLLKLFLFSKR